MELSGGEEIETLKIERLSLCSFIRAALPPATRNSPQKQSHDKHLRGEKNASVESVVGKPRSDRVGRSIKRVVISF